MQTTILEARDLRIRRGSRVVVDGLWLTLEPGVTALLGPNGAGKTTLIEALADPSRLSAGAVKLEGLDVAGGAAARRAFAARIGVMPQTWRWFAGFSVLESVEYVAWLKLVPRQARRDRAREALELVGLTDRTRDRVSSLSGGMRQRVGLAEALVNAPEVLLLDEPTVGLDPAQRADFRDALVAGSSGRATLLSTHLTDDVAAVADRVLVLADGAIMFDGTPADLADRATERSGDEARDLESGYLAVLGHERRQR